MSDKDIDAEFFNIVETSLSDAPTFDEVAQEEIELIDLARAVARLNELSTFLGKFIVASLTLGPSRMAPLGEDIMFGISETEKMAALVIEDLMEYANGCDCPDCLCECDDLPPDEVCDSCIRLEYCECGLDGTCTACIEYDLKNPSD